MIINTLHYTVIHDVAGELVADEDTEGSPLVASDPDVLPGDSVKVWWDEEEIFFPCVVKSQKPDTDSTTASECRYDGDAKTYWHNLEAEEYRHIAPTVERLSKVTVNVIKQRLRM